MTPKFAWERKSNGTFYLHGWRWMAYVDNFSGKVVAGPNFGLYPMEDGPKFTKSMKKTLELHWEEIVTTLKENENEH